MTMPPFNPPSSDPGGAGDATQPVNLPPAPAPPAPGFQPGATYQPGAGYAPSGSDGPPTGPSREPVVPFQPVSPEPALLVQPTATGGSARSSRMLNVALGAAVLVAVVGVSFAIGRATAPAAASTTGRFGGFGGNLPNASFNPNGENGTGGFGGGFRGAFGGGFGGGLTIQGTVQSVGSDSITITTANGANVTIGLDSSTTYHQQAAGSASDVQAGKTVILQVTGGAFRGGDNNGTGNNGTGNNGTGNNGTGTSRLGTASDVTVVP